MSDSLSLGGNAQTITFDEIPADRRDPDVLVEVRPNYRNTGLLRLPSKAVVVSQMLAGGKAKSGQLYAIVADGQGEYLFGAGSIAACQINAWRRNNTTTPLFAAALLDPNGGAKAAVTGTISGPGFQDGFAVFINGFAVTVLAAGVRVPVVMPPGSTQNDLAAAIVAAINANPALPVTAIVPGNAPNSYQFIAKNAGLCGNDIAVKMLDRSDASAPLVSLFNVEQGNGAATPCLQLSGGLGVPDMAPVLAGIAGTWFTELVMPWSDPLNRATLAAELVRRYGAMVNLDMRGWLGISGSYASVTNFGDAGNSRQMVTVAVRGNNEPAWVWAAAWGAVHAFRLANDPSRQSKGIAVAGLTAPDPTDQWTAQERDMLLRNGLSTWTALNDGTVVIGRTITGYLTSNLGIADTAWLDVMTPATMTAIRYDWRAYVKLLYPQAKLFQDDSVGAEYDGTAATPRRMRGSWAARCQDYERAGWIDGTAATVQQGYFVVNESDRNRLDQQVVVSVVGNLMIEATALEFAA